MDRTLYQTRLENLHAWAGHLWRAIETAVPGALEDLSIPGEETPDDARAAAATLQAVARALDDVMAACDLLLEAVERPRRFDDFLQGLVLEGGPPSATGQAALGPQVEINRAHFARLAAELHYDAGWLMGAIHGAMTCGEAGHLDGHLDGLVSGIEEAMISYDRLQGVIGALPARHDAYLDRLVVLEEEPRRRPRGRPE